MPHLKERVLLPSEMRTVSKDQASGTVTDWKGDGQAQNTTPHTHSYSTTDWVFPHLPLSVLSWDPAVFPLLRLAPPSLHLLYFHCTLFSLSLSALKLDCGLGLADQAQITPDKQEKFFITFSLSNASNIILGSPAKQVEKGRKISTGKCWLAWSDPSPTPCFSFCLFSSLLTSFFLTPWLHVT